MKYIKSKWALALVGFLLVFATTAQRIPPAEMDRLMNSENGWQLPAHGTIKVFVVFVEVDYDVNPDQDPVPKGSDAWRPNQLPKYADNLFDTEVFAEPKAKISRYYHHNSLGHLQVIGDYWFETITVKESEVKRLSLPGIRRAVSDQLATYDNMLAGNGSELASFDRWRGDTRVGMPRINEPDDPTSFDHVMMFVRNFHGLPHDNGSASPGSFATVAGHGSDSFSQFNGSSKLPASILQHEFNHLLVGGNNFHCCGGGSPAYAKLFIPGMYGWGLMGAANASLGTCNAWDRHRLGWKHPDKQHLISAMDELGQSEKPSDLVTTNPEMAGKYLLRDFMTTGDALRIKLPYFSGGEYQQYLWVENHLGAALNGVDSDRFRYELRDGFTSVAPGLFMMVQVGREEKRGLSAYSGHSNYLRPVLADGHYDVQWTGDSLAMYGTKRRAQVHYKPAEFANPLTGSQDMEAISYNKNPSDSTLEVKDMVDPEIERTADGSLIYFPKFGHAKHAFRIDGNKRIGMGTNPSSASVRSFMSASRIPAKPHEKNNNRTYLNGISIEIIEEKKDGALLVEVRFDDTAINEKVRWCSDTIVLNSVPGAAYDLELAAGAELLLDLGETPTRRSRPNYREGKQVFISPSVLVLKSGTKTVLRRKSMTIVDHCSQIIVEPGAELTVERGAKVILKNGAELIIEQGATVNGLKRIKKRGGGITQMP